MSDNEWIAAAIIGYAACGWITVSIGVATKRIDLDDFDAAPDCVMGFTLWPLLVLFGILFGIVALFMLTLTPAEAFAARWRQCPCGERLHKSINFCPVCGKQAEAKP